MHDPFEHRTLGLTGPAKDIQPVTPDDQNSLAHVAVALYVETGGNLSLLTAAGETRSVTVADFTILPVGVRRVNATGTTASGIHAMVIS